MELKRIKLLVFLVLMSTCAFASDNNFKYEYDIVGVAIAKEGYYLVEVSARVDKKREATLNTVKKCAIHGTLFKGFAVERVSQRPIITSPVIETEHAGYFKELIESHYESYVAYSQPLRIVKLNKGYKVSAVVVVAKELLRKELERAGIVSKLGL